MEFRSIIPRGKYEGRDASELTVVELWSVVAALRKKRTGAFYWLMQREIRRRGLSESELKKAARRERKDKRKAIRWAKNDEEDRQQREGPTAMFNGKPLPRLNLICPTCGRNKRRQKRDPSKECCGLIVMETDWVRV